MSETREKTPQELCETIKGLLMENFQAREAIATLRHDLRLTQDAHIEALGERDEARAEIERIKVDLANMSHRAEVWKQRDEMHEAKLSKLEAVRVAAKAFNDSFKNLFNKEFSYGIASQLQHEALKASFDLGAALRSTEAHCHWEDCPDRYVKGHTVHLSVSKAAPRGREE
jgi:chromosome segregation ATPase